MFTNSDPIQPQDLAITLLGAYVRPDPRPVWSGGMVHLLQEFAFSTTAARAALSRLVRRGLLDRVKEGRLVFYAITERCEQLLEEGDRRIFSLGREDTWDGTWTVLWHSIPERQRLERARLGRRLRFLGFGSVQDGTWISPHNREREVLALVQELRVQEHVGVLLGSPAAGLHIDQVIRRSWNPEELASRYERFVAEFSRYAGEQRRQLLTEREAFLARTRLVHSFRQFPFLDPELPDALMPRHRMRRQAATIFHDVYEGLADPARSYFNSVTAPQGARAGQAAVAAGGQ